MDEVDLRAIGDEALRKGEIETPRLEDWAFASEA